MHTNEAAYYSLDPSQKRITMTKGIWSCYIIWLLSFDYYKKQTNGNVEYYYWIWNSCLNENHEQGFGSSADQIATGTGRSDGGGASHHVRLGQELPHFSRGDASWRLPSPMLGQNPSPHRRKYPSLISFSFLFLHHSFAKIDVIHDHYEQRARRLIPLHQLLHNEPDFLILILILILMKLLLIVNGNANDANDGDGGQGSTAPDYYAPNTTKSQSESSICLPRGTLPPRLPSIKHPHRKSHNRNRTTSTTSTTSRSASATVAAAAAAVTTTSTTPRKTTTTTTTKKPTPTTPVSSSVWGQGISLNHEKVMDAMNDVANDVPNDVTASETEELSSWSAASTTTSPTLLLTALLVALTSLKHYISIVC